MNVPRSVVASYMKEIDPERVKDEGQDDLREGP